MLNVSNGYIEHSAYRIIIGNLYTFPYFVHNLGLHLY